MRITKQRRAVLDTVRFYPGHPTADEIYLKTRDKINNISLGTVYGNLNGLCDLGLVRKIAMPNGPDCFDGNVKAHDHMLCISCGKLMDRDLPKPPQLDEEVLDGAKFIGHKLLLLCICRRCLEKNRQEVEETHG